MSDTLHGEWRPVVWQETELGGEIVKHAALDGKEIKICEFVPGEPITPDALEAAGWNKKNHDDLGTLHIWRLGRMSIEVYLSVYGVYSESTSINIYVVDALGNDDREHRIRLPGCTTMQQLRALVEMLGGES